jgi:hypothetical protein
MDGLDRSSRRTKASGGYRLFTEYEEESAGIRQCQRDCGKLKITMEKGKREYTGLGKK